MGILNNLKIGGVAAEDITLDGQEVKEVWVDGVQVFDAYDPAKVPDAPSSYSVSKSYTGTYMTNSNEPTWITPVYATGRMKLSINSENIPGNMRVEDKGSCWYHSWLKMMSPGESSPIAEIYVMTARFISSDYGTEDFPKLIASARGAGTVTINNFRQWQLDWNFHNGTVTINGNTYPFTARWKESLYFQYGIYTYGYMDTSDNWQTSTVSCTYQVTRV